MGTNNKFCVVGRDTSIYRHSSVFTTETYDEQLRFISKLKQISEMYGGDTKMSSITKLIKPLGHRCPRCEGKGFTVEEYNTSMEWYVPGYRDVKCTLCDGKGYTDVEYVKKYKTVEDGYEVKG